MNNLRSLRTLVVCAIVGMRTVTAATLPNHSHDHNHVAHGFVLPSDHWYQDEDHPAVKLFRRQDPSTLPDVGSEIWSALYPEQISYDPNQMPAEWVAALDAAVAAGKIPDIPPSISAGVYPAGVDATSPEVCTATFQCRAPGDIWDAPTGVIGIAFDDGPLSPSPTLYSFLQSQNVLATHFMIGINILNNPQIFLQAFNNNNHIAVHTYTHPYMTTLNNTAVLAELGWTMQIMHDSTGGRVPKFWRPPYGDADMRTRAIAEIFGLTTVVWNQDSNDWEMTEVGGPTPAQVSAELQGWYAGPKTPGLIILEHELSDDSVQAFITNFPSIAANGWQITNIPGTVNSSWYQNSEDSTSPVASMDPLGSAGLPTSTAAPANAVATASSSTSSPTPSHKSSAALRTIYNHDGLSIFARLAVLGLAILL